MKIVALGTGTSQGIPVIGCHCEVCLSTDIADNRLRSALYIESSETSILIDIGPDFRTQFLQNKLQTVDQILITHEHNDHIIGLDDIRAINFTQNKSIPVFASHRVSNDIKARFNYIFGPQMYPGLPRVSLHEIDDEPFAVKDLTITPIKVMHGRLPILGYRINNMAYITDASFIPETEYAKLQGLNVLIINALRHKKHHSHYNMEEALAVVKRLQPQRTYLTHISHLMGKTAQWEKQLPAAVRSLKDTMIIEVPQ